MGNLMLLEGLRVLLVDDDGDSCLLFAEVLSAAGATVEMVLSGPEGIALLEANPPDVLVADLMMPSMDGFELMRRLREGGWNGPALAVSAAVRAADVRRAFNAGFDEHLAKPVDIDILVTRVAELVNLRGGR